MYCSSWRVSTRTPLRGGCSPLRRRLRGRFSLEWSVVCDVVDAEGSALSRDVFAAALRHGGFLRAEGVALHDLIARYFANAQRRAQVRTDRGAGELAALVLTGVLAPLLVHDAAGTDALRETLARAADAFVHGVHA